MINPGRNLISATSKRELSLKPLSLDGPKLLLTMMDPYSYLRDGLKVKELDTPP